MDVGAILTVLIFVGVLVLRAVTEVRLFRFRVGKERFRKVHDLK